MPHSTPPANFLESYRAQPGLLGKVQELLSRCFHGMEERFKKANRMEIYWERVSAPFVVMQNSRVVSHLGYMDYRLVSDGKLLGAGVLHAGCTAIECRENGYFKMLMHDALGHAAERNDAVLVFTRTPEAFESYGFKVFSEHVTEIENTTGAPGSSMRKLDLLKVQDFMILERLLHCRRPVSEAFSAVGHAQIYLFNLMDKAFYYDEKHELAVCYEEQGETLHLFDILCCTQWELVDVLGLIGSRAKKVRLYFCPPEDIEGVAIPLSQADTEIPMMLVRGEIPKLNRPGMLPAGFRC